MEKEKVCSHFLLFGLQIWKCSQFGLILQLLMTPAADNMHEKDAARSAMERLTHYLESRHLRKTPERFAILSRSLRLPEHFSGDALADLMERDGYHVSRSTVYNTLALLCEAEILVCHRFGNRAARYEVALQNHCHLICRRCGKVEEVESPDFAGVIRSMASEGFRPTSFSASVYGLCADCIQYQNNNILNS